jgi:hypothetical protein
VTESEWNASADPDRMLRSLAHRKRRTVPGGPGLHPERFRVFAVACCRRVWDHLTQTMQGVLRHLERDPEDQEPDTRSLAWRISQSEGERLGSQWALEMATILHGQADYRALVRLDNQRRACGAVGSAAMIKPYDAAKHAARAAAQAVGVPEILAGYPASQPVPRAAADRVGHESAAERQAQADLLRDVFGNPFRPVPFDPRWRTDTAVSLARQMRESREFSAMPILADALQDAGCETTDILGHCRGPGPHVRGCWVVDLVLGK